jgi:RNA polymerase sigma-70 factor (ECF subfamily)
VRWKHLPAHANGQLAVGCYLFDARQGRYVPAVIDVLTLAGDKIAAVTGFLALNADEYPGTRLTDAELFARFGLPAGPR